MLTTIRYLLLTAIRDRLFLCLFLALLLATGLSALLGATAFLEGQQMTLVFSAGASRLILMVGIIVFGCFHIRQAFDSKEIDVMLSRPQARHSLLLAYWLGLYLVFILLALPVCAVVALLGVGNWPGYAAWAASLLMEGALVLAMVLFAAFTLRSAVAAVMGCLGFYVLSRMMVFFIMTSMSGLVGKTGVYVLFRYMLEAISAIVPRLDMYGKSSWLVYGVLPADGWWWLPAQTLVFVPLLLLAAMADFRRRQF